jgi:hypothetical protein
MYQGTMVEELMEMVMRAEERAKVARLSEPLEMHRESFLFGLPESQAVMIGVA